MEPFLLLEEEGSTEDADWIGEIGSTVSDGASEADAEEAMENSLVDADIGSREAKEQERMDAAVAALKCAWATRCPCGKACYDFLQILLSC
jgi:hypothetical protein